MSMGQNSIANISDFAKDLLYDMRLGKDKAMGDLEIGKVTCLTSECEHGF